MHLFQKWAAAFRSGAAFRKVAIWLAVISAAVYLIVLPSVDSYFAQFEERPTSFVVEDLNAFEIARIRSAKLVVFAIFAYLGACVASFLNVVAASAPRGEAIGLRSSFCPKCEQRICRLDNIPLLSYLMLQGRCRSCGVVIPVRYFVVELIGFGIFASLFLYELTTGAANVPGFLHYTYTGIVWIILYAKWPVIGIFVFHAFLFSALLMFVLMEVDGLRCPRWMSFSLVALFAIIATLGPHMQPTAFDDRLPFELSKSLPPVVARAVTSFVGGAVGALIAFAIGRFRWLSPLSVAWILLGVSLGWHAIVMIGLLTLLVWIAGRTGGKSRVPEWFGATAMLFLAATIHHPLWNLLSQLW
ncbi:MAG: prepilin peptidase [Planctomycetota bacterium]